MSPLQRACVSPRLLLLDVLPYLLPIVQPPLRAVNTQLYSQREKQELFHVLNTMIAYNLTYTQVSYN